ncbi:MAG: DivIVA domain-containing protein [Acidobacteriota bacterium]
MATPATLTPLDIRRTTFERKMRGYDAEQVDDFLEVAADQLGLRLGEIERLAQENRQLRAGLEQAAQRQSELQEALLHAQKLSKDITDNARREADVMLREAEVTADNIVSQAIEQANRIESKLTELRTMRRDLHLKFRNSLDLFRQILDADMADERSTAIIRTLPRRQDSA